MFEHVANRYAAYFLPGPAQLATDEAVALGLQWLLAQRGQPLIVLSRKGNVSNNRVLDAAVKRFRILYTAPPRVYDPSWKGGSILVPWAGEKALLEVDEHLAEQADAVCVIGWAEGQHDVWIAGHDARDLRDPQTKLAAPHVDPVVAVAMTHASNSINHGNGLVTDAEKGMVVLTLEELVRGGHTYDVDQLAAWAIASGWSPAEIPKLREYATKVLEGRKFRLRDPYGPRAGAVKAWEAEAAANDAG